MNPTLAVRYDPRLIEEAVFHARRHGHVLKGFDAQRNRIYQVSDPDDRERLFHELHYSWFVRLGLNQTIDEALQEQPLIAAQVGSCFIVCAAESNAQGAELFVAQEERPENPGRRTLRILLTPESLSSPPGKPVAPSTTPVMRNPQREPAAKAGDRVEEWHSTSLMTLLRCELFHIADMLDADFAYEPSLPKAEGGPTYDTLITNRYRVLWDITIHGRMTRRGWLPESDRADQLAYFRDAFPMLKDNADESFDPFFDSDRPTHPELVAFAFDPRNAGGSAGDPCAPGTHCPLCKFPTHSFEPKPENLGDDVLAAIKGDFENWMPSMGLCAQCADLYRASRLSLAALKLLPGWTPSPTSEPTLSSHERGRVAAGGK
jgi:hypothetical protein